MQFRTIFSFMPMVHFAKAVLYEMEYYDSTSCSVNGAVHGVQINLAHECYDLAADGIAFHIGGPSTVAQVPLGCKISGYSDAGCKGGLNIELDGPTNEEQCYVVGTNMGQHNRVFLTLVKHIGINTDKGYPASPFLLRVVFSSPDNDWALLNAACTLDKALRSSLGAAVRDESMKAIQPASAIGAVLWLLLIRSVALAHTVITYPGWRGDNLITNETFPYGMQWIYPCGGFEVTSNRTYWSTGGGAIAFQPGWFLGHAKAILQINLGLGKDGPHGGPLEMSVPLVPPFTMLGPSNDPFPGTICLPEVSIPSTAGVKPGDNATIQVILTAQHGATLFSCSDITFVDKDDLRIPSVNGTNCFNSTDIGFANIYTIPQAM